MLHMYLLALLCNLVLLAMFYNVGLPYTDELYQKALIFYLEKRPPSQLKVQGSLGKELRGKYIKW